MVEKGSLVGLVEFVGVGEGVEERLLVLVAGAVGDLVDRLGERPGLRALGCAAWRAMVSRRGGGLGGGAGRLRLARGWR